MTPDGHAEFVGRRRCECRVAAQDRARLIPVVDNRSREHVARRTEADAQGGHDAEVAAAAAQGPVQVGLRVGTGCHAPPVRQHDFGAEQVVRRQPASTTEGAVAAPQGQAGHADRAAVAQCRDQAMGAGGDGHILGPGATCDSGHKGSRVHRDIPHPGEVDDEPIVAQGAPRPVVPAAAHRQR
jgi:hypothetical protein